MVVPQPRVYYDNIGGYPWDGQDGGRPTGRGHGHGWKEMEANGRAVFGTASLQ